MINTAEPRYQHITVTIVTFVATKGHEYRCICETFIAMIMLRCSTKYLIEMWLNACYCYLGLSNTTSFVCSFVHIHVFVCKVCTNSF